jgi:hypothetical protein
MGPTAGMKQETNQLNTNQQQQQQDLQGQQQSLGAFNTAVNQAGTDVTNLDPSIAAGQSSVNAQQADVPLQQNSVNQQQQDVNALGANPGYTPAEIASMKANAAGQTHAAYGSAIDQIKQNSANSGGNVGEYTQLGQLAQNRAIAANNAGNNIDTQAANAALTEREALPGQQAGVTAGQQGVTQAQQGVTSGQAGITGQLGSEAQLQQGVANETFQPAQLLGNEATATGNQDVSLIGQTSKTPFLQQLATAGLGAAGQALGAYAKGGCWIAAALWDGWLDDRTIVTRAWLNGPFSETAIGRKVMALYLRFGRAIAAQITKRGAVSRLLRLALGPLFEMALKRARKWARG